MLQKESFRKNRKAIHNNRAKADQKIHNDVIREATNILVLSKKIDKHEYLTGE